MVSMMFTGPLVTAATMVAVLILHILTLPANAQCPCEGALPALQSLYNATDGPHWINPWQNMFSGASVCSLSGINCSSNGNIWIDLPLRHLVGTIPDDFAVRYPRVAMFAVSLNNLRGTLPRSFALFGEHIGVFDVSNNAQLGGTLPTEFSNWTMMNTFWVQNCSIKGTLPSAYASWGSNLRSFYFYSNDISGTIPPEYSAWSSTSEFSGSDNLINGTIPRALISAWKDTMYDFSLSRNGLLTGDLFGSDGNGFCEWIRIYNFIASDNMFSGSIPSCLSNWGTTIEQLSVSNNLLAGTLPSSLQSWTVVRNIEFGTNFFEGTLPAVYSLMKKMKIFNAKNNKLTGTLPPQYGQWSSLLRFYVDGNQLSGTLPDEYYGWGSSVFDIRISQNNLSGTLPASWGVFTNVERLSLSFNQLTGTLPSSYSAMTSLVVLSLDLNQLQGPLPASWQSLTALQAVGLQYNYNLQGPIPPSWSSMRRLLVMAVCNTSICGNASMFFLVGAFGFTCPQPSALANPDLDTAALQQYILASERYSSFPCISTPAPASPTPLPSLQPARNNETTAVLPYTALAQSSATAAVWSVVRPVP
ncbi:GP46-like surface antigen, putative [Bodo saltans]|uniref:GP46-like surface antigen, putative n=1 Tax=Bodo saltans TaxID=75058 RepID=A0A0S4J2H8_BODSA|nr:GP46-like surface antigen, putative [Bodo saltans]|eukprot:CUG63717.1 GP46-like surface antigen, putative [Bodo saltans]